MLGVPPGHTSQRAGDRWCNILYTHGLPPARSRRNVAGGQTGCKIQIFSFPFYTLSPEYQIIANFSELVLLCIEADFCTQIRIFQHFSRSTRFSHFCTAFICKIRFKHRSKFCKNCTFFVNFHYFCSKSTFFAPILMNFSRNFTDFQYSRVDIR